MEPNTSNSLRDALIIGYRAFSRNWFPALILQSGMALILALYYLSPVSRPFFEWIMNIQNRGGMIFTFIASGFATGVVAEVMRVYTVDGGKWRKEHWDAMIFKFIFLGFMGVVTAYFYLLQVWLFGTEVNVSTLAKKVIVDQLVYSTLFANPIQVLAFGWKNAGYSWRKFKTELFPLIPFVERQWLPLVISNWFFWTPTISILYSLPTSLQIPMFIVAAAIWGILITHVTATRPAK